MESGELRTELMRDGGTHLIRKVVNADWKNVNNSLHQLIHFKEEIHMSVLRQANVGDVFPEKNGYEFQMIIP